MGLTQEQVAAYEPVIGLEVHVQLKTASKIFCGCSTRFGDPPNTHICPVCLGLPGSLPVLNRQALELAVRAALALNCQVRERSRFARKNYFYPDLPKGYQISQYELPLSEHGGLEIPLNGGLKRIGITRVHLEEDAGKSLHEGFPDSDKNTYLDFNRCGVPLIEIVSEPDLRTPAEAYEYLTTLKQILEYIEVSDCDMEKGSLRCDANLSVRRRGAEKFGVKAEVKNLNSFRYLVRALEYEIERQVALLESGGSVEQETRLFNVTAGRTEPMRSKEFAHDYRYFPEPDLLPPMIDSAWRDKIRREMPELPAAKRTRFAGDYGLTDYDAGVLTATRALADYFEAAAKSSPNPKAAANWIQSELLALLKDSGKEIGDSPVAPSAVGELLGLVEGGTLSGKMAKAVFAQMFATGKPAKEIIAAEKMEQVTDTGEIERLCRQALEANPQQVEAYKKGKTALFAFFVGQVMKASRGQANPQLVNDTLKKLLQ
ncbi:MAG TPA: Asp-tRNA(Asn)/Glu-tRNA(Gln) amidotransferase subunit GatB [Candidatus Acidoferrales bacterium]|nr:Asp-tRNA(Asn)/Glu-tRNA(Gln) amidotransferase subunit GatB [Candidatus Acidoferrales bacterium]